MAGDSLESAFERHPAEIATSLRKPTPERNGCAPLPISSVGCRPAFAIPLAIPNATSAEGDLLQIGKRKSGIQWRWLDHSGITQRYRKVCG
jgi:hypothetical protein